MYTAAVRGYFPFINLGDWKKHIHLLEQICVSEGLQRGKIFRNIFTNEDGVRLAYVRCPNDTPPTQELKEKGEYWSGIKIFLKGDKDNKTVQRLGNYLRPIKEVPNQS